MKVVFGGLALGANVDSLGVIRIAFEINNRPLSDLQKDGVPVGFEVEVARQLCVEMRTHCVFTPIKKINQIGILLANDVDILLSFDLSDGILMPDVSLTKKYYNRPFKLMIRKDSFLTYYITKLKGKKIGLFKNSKYFMHKFIQMTNLGVKVISYESIDEMHSQLLNGNIDGILTDKIDYFNDSLYFVYKNSFVFIGPDFFIGDGISLAVHAKNIILVNKLNDAIKKIADNGALKDIESRYFKFEIYEDAIK